ncbi:UxaA family hydrolase [Brucella intermedia]|uniref:UxaA family hydrolase n=1 Tax=Brucella intermedia TaxID=94625 RepID=UPI00197EA72C|nr:UxaA family hydrolase [Brucella intermedia]
MQIEDATGSAISPVIKVCANPETCRKLAGDMDVDAGRLPAYDRGKDVRVTAEPLTTRLIVD